MADSRWNISKNEKLFKAHILKHAKQINAALEKKKEKNVNANKRVNITERNVDKEQTTNVAKENNDVIHNNNNNNANIDNEVEEAADNVM